MVANNSIQVVFKLDSYINLNVRLEVLTNAKAFEIMV